MLLTLFLILVIASAPSDIWRRTEASVHYFHDRFAAKTHSAFSSESQLVPALPLLAMAIELNKNFREDGSVVNGGSQFKIA